MNPENFSRYRLPLSALLALAIVGYGFYITYQKNIALDGVGKDSSAATTTNTYSEKDADQDGLPDWEEAVYDSNPNVADTDQDGTSDGDEVKAGRNPTKAGPDDKLPILDIPSFATSSSDLLGIKKEFYAKFLKSEGSQIRKATFKDLISQFDPNEFRPKYNLIDLNISSDNSPAALRTYANSFGTVIDQYKHTSKDEFAILEKALPSKDWKKLQELQLPAITYRNFANDLRKLKVPSVMAEKHLLIVNGYDVISRALLAMMYFVSDPIRGAGAYQAYLMHLLLVTEGYSGVVELLHTHNVTFSEQETGYYFHWRGWGIIINNTNT